MIEQGVGCFHRSGETLEWDQSAGFQETVDDHKDGGKSIGFRQIGQIGPLAMWDQGCGGIGRGSKSPSVS